MDVLKGKLTTELLPQSMGWGPKHNCNFSLKFISRNFEERIADMEVSIGTLGKQAQRESDLGSSDRSLLHKCLNTNNRSLLQYIADRQ